MAKSQIPNDEELQLLADAEGGEFDAPPDHSPAQTSGDGWNPDLNPTQKKAFDDPAKSILMYGERGSGKTIAAGHKVIRHVYENDGALGLVIMPSIFSGKEGIWHDLETLILPAWRQGIGLDYEESRQDPDTKDRIRWVGNVYNGWSKLILKSIPHANYVAARMKGPAYSFIVADELTECEGDEYYTTAAQGLTRRRGMVGPQQYVGCCNPKGPSHWVYKTFFEDTIDKVTGLRDPNVSIYHVPLSENIHRIGPEYKEQLLRVIKDPIQRRRLIDGEWIDQPSGEAIFRDYFSTELHVKGNAIAGTGLNPVAGFPIICGYDPGPVNFSVHFMQLVWIKSLARYVWIVFDELNLVGKPTAYAHVVPQVLRKMDFWNSRVGTQFAFEHISDEAAFTHKRTNGSYDATEIKNLSRGRIRLKSCPKGKESVPARVKCLMDLLTTESIFISALCTKTIDMFNNLTSQKTKDGEYDEFSGFRPQRSAYLHPFDSITYPLFYKQMHGALSIPVVNKIETRCYQAGSN